MEDGTPKHIIQMTGFKMEEKEALGKLLLKLDCTFIKSEKYKNCTHLIAERLCKSEKFLAACAAGKWVLTKDYVIHSARSGRWLDETTYEWGYKIEKDSHCSLQMQSAPKRVLEAGKANIILPKDSPSGITHVIATNTIIKAEQGKDNFKAPFYPIQYIEDFLLEKEIQNDEVSQTNSVWKKQSNQENNKDFREDMGFEMKGALKEAMCRTQALYYESYIIFTDLHKEIQNHDEDVNISSILTEHHKKEKFRGSNKDLKFLKMRYALQRHTYGNQKKVKNSLFADHAKESETKHVRTDVDIAEIKNALRKHIYKAQAIRYSCIRIDKQPVYNIEVRGLESCLFNEGFCHQISKNTIGSKVLHLTLLKFFFNLVESEVQHLSQKLNDWCDSQSLKITGKAILEIFCSGSETSGLLTKPVNMLLDWTIYSQTEKCKSNDVRLIYT
ncbi:hypothetical protein MC885_017447 [Smutsia gigantea]|nr:hypothetical protein MC885_017447 [Smutsia gigantea]